MLKAVHQYKQLVLNSHTEKLISLVYHNSAWDGLPVAWCAVKVPIRSFVSCNLNSLYANFFVSCCEQVYDLDLSASR